MALSGTYAFTENTNKIVNNALRKAGLLGLGQKASGQLFNDAVDALNAMVMAWQSDGIFLWTTEEYTVNTVASTKTVDLDSKVIYVPRAFIRISNNDHPMDLITFDEYQSFNRKDTEGRPFHGAVDGQHATDLKMYLRPVPDQVYALHYMGVRKLQDFKAGKDADFPVRWTKALIYGLTVDLMYDKGSPVNEITLLEAKAAQEKRAALAGNRELTGPNYMQGAY